MNLTSPATYRILLALLDRKEVSQRELSESLEISPSHVHRVFRWLEDNRFVERGSVERRSRRGRSRDVYVLVNPTGLLRTISLFRSMDRLRRFVVAVDVPKERLLADLRRHPVVFCLGTALERFSHFYRPDEISFYAFEGEGSEGVDSIRREVSAWKEGITRVGCYALETKTHGRRKEVKIEPRDALERVRAFGYVDKTRRGYFTTKVMTVVDLFCDEKAFAARDLLKELWGVEL